MNIAAIETKCRLLGVVLLLLFNLYCVCLRRFCMLFDAHRHLSIPTMLSLC
jgi:hypothetical protein